jgi:hypothetical protein
MTNEEESLAEKLQRRIDAARSNGISEDIIVRTIPAWREQLVSEEIHGPSIPSKPKTEESFLEQAVRDRMFYGPPPPEPEPLSLHPELREDQVRERMNLRRRRDRE